MKKPFLGFLLAVLLWFSPLAHATLWDRGGGLIYDDVLDITWSQNVNLAATQTFGVGGIDPFGRMSWYTTSDYLNALNASYYLGYNDWRLPKTLPGSGSIYNYNLSYDGSTDHGFNISAPGSLTAESTASEMAYMFYVNLGNKGYYGFDGSWPKEGYSAVPNGFFESGGTGGTLASFQNLFADGYWSETICEGFAGTAWRFGLPQGGQGYQGMESPGNVWVVRDGDSSPVPEPATMLLLASGLAGLAGLRKKLRKR